MRSRDGHELLGFGMRIRIVLALLAAGLSGCVRFLVFNSADYSLSGYGQPAPDGNPDHARYLSLTVDLLKAPPFIVVLPDGFAAHSKAINAALLERHFAPVRKDERRGLVSQIDVAQSKHKTASGKFESASTVFFLGADGRARTLYLVACNHVMRGVLATADGRQHFDFPLTQGEIFRLFQLPIRTESHSGMYVPGISYDCD
jgi:hypothetical protein